MSFTFFNFQGINCVIEGTGVIFFPQRAGSRDTRISCTKMAGHKDEFNLAGPEAGESFFI